MDYEHQPNPGPGLWIGAGLLLLAGGLSMVYVGLASDGDRVLAVAGGVAALSALVALAAGVQLARIRR